ncbi:MAG: ribosome biogenesis GTP-binding protein YihA/YsxC [Bdellovibrionota bacterium]
MDTSYITSAQKANQLPIFALPEVAFIGRSNCGKSSLLNAITGRKNLARSSSTPGRTQMMNFFSVSKRLILADLPGYGFNVASKSVQQHWDALMNEYISRSNIKEFLFLVDIRRQFEEFEFNFLSTLAGLNEVAVVLTKIDKLKKNELLSKKKEIQNVLGAKNIALTKIFAVSSLKKTGIEDLKRHVLRHSEDDMSSESPEA